MILVRTVEDRTLLEIPNKFKGPFWKSLLDSIILRTLLKSHFQVGHDGVARGGQPRHARVLPALLVRRLVEGEEGG